jgi:Tfp pilus assembly protein PilO
MKVENRQQFLIVLTAVAAALLIGNSLIYEPLSKVWTARSKQIAGLRQQVKDGNSLIKREAGIRSRWSDMSANALPANTSLAENQTLTAFTAWSRGSGAEITSIMPQWKNDATNYMTLNCRLEASGTMATLSQFLYQIEKGPMAFKLDSVELAAHDNTGQQLTLGLQVSGLALLQPTTQVKR